MISTTLLRTRLLAFNTFSLTGITAKTLNFFANESRTRGEQRFGFDNIISRLSVTENLDEIWEIYSKGKKTLTTEHYAVLSRSISRAIKKRDAQIDIQKYREMEKQIKQHSGKFNPQQYSDLLFLLRVVKSKGKLSNIKNDTIDEIVRNVNQHIKNQQYMFRTLTSIYYDLSILNKVTQDLKYEILEKLNQEVKKEHLRNISIFNISQILRAISYRNNVFYPQTEILITCLDMIQKNNLDAELNLPQKVDLFKIVAELDLENNYSNIRIPKFMERLKSQFEKDLEELNEKSIFMIFEALEKLPFKYQSLGDQLKTIIIDNFEGEEGEKSSITFGFLVQILDRISNWKKRKFTLDEQQKIIDFLDKELDTFQNDNRRKLQKFIFVLSKSVFNGNNTKLILEKLNKKLKPELYTNNQIQLSISYNLNIQNIISTYYNNTIKNNNNNKFLKLKFYNAITSCTQPQIQNIINQLEPQVFAILESQPFFFLNVFKDSLIDSKRKVKLCEKLIDRIFKLQNLSSLNRGDRILILRTIISVSTTKSNFNLLKNYLNQNQSNFESIQIFKAIQEQLDQQGYHQINMIYYLLESKNLEFNLGQFTSIFFNDTFIRNSLKNLSRKFFHYIDTIIFFRPARAKDSEGYVQRSPINQNLYRIIKKLQDLKCENEQYRYLLKKVSLSPIQIKNVSLFCNFVDILIGKDLINSENAAILLQNIKQKNVPYYKNIFKSFVTPDQKPDYQYDNLTIKNISLLLFFNPNFYENKLDAIMQRIKEDLKKHEWELLLFSLRNFRGNEKYKAITIALIEKFQTYAKSYRWSENIRIGTKLSTLQIKSKKFWNQFLGHFYEQTNLTTDEIVSTFSLFSYIKFYNNKFIEYVFQKINQQIFYYKNYSNKIINSLYRFNHQLSAQQLTLIEKLYDDNKDVGQLIQLVKYLSIQSNNQNSQALIQKILNQIQQTPTEKVQNGFNILYLIKKYPQYKNKLLAIVGAQRSELRWAQAFSGFYELFPEVKAYPERFCKILNLSLEKNVKLGEQFFEFKINDQYFKLLRRGDLDMSGTRLIGNVEIQRKYLQELYNVKINILSVTQLAFSEKKSSLFQKYFNISSKTAELNALDQEFIINKKQNQQQKQVIQQEVQQTKSS